MSLIALALTAATFASPCSDRPPLVEEFTLPTTEDPDSLQARLYFVLRQLWEKDPDAVGPTLRVQTVPCGDGAVAAILDDGDRFLICRVAGTNAIKNYQCQMALPSWDLGWSTSEKSVQEVLYRAVFDGYGTTVESAQSYVRLAGIYSGEQWGEIRCTTRGDADGGDRYACEIHLSFPGSGGND